MPTFAAFPPDVSGHLLRAGIPVTAQRLAIARVLLPLPVHLSAEQVQQCQPLHQRLVARHGVQHLKLFTARGLLRELAVEPGKTMFDSNPPPHHHLYNSATGELTDIPADTLRLSGAPVLPDGLGWSKSK